MKVHPAAEMFPMMDDAALSDLAADIKINGLLNPITTDDAEEFLIDGRNRLAACKIAGVKPTFQKLNGHDPVAFILSNNIARRHMSKAQQAMVVAMIYPDKEKPGPKSKDKQDRIIFIRSIANKDLLNQARTILEILPGDAKQVLAGTKMLGETYKEAITHNKSLVSEETQRAQLQSAAPDLAELVNEERMSFSEAWKVFESRKTELEAAEENKRETFFRVAEQAYRANIAWSSPEFEAELSERLGDKEFRQKFADRVRFNADEIKLIERGAKTLASILKRQLKKGK